MFIQKIVRNLNEGEVGFTGISIILMSDDYKMIDKVDINKEKFLKIPNEENQDIYEHLKKLEDEDKLLYMNELKRIYEI